MTIIRGEIRGKAEAIKLLFAYLNVPYEFISYNPDEFYKWFKEDKHELNN